MFKARKLQDTDPMIGCVKGDYVRVPALDHSDGYKVPARKWQDNPAL
jgi:hypothetical protein